MTIFDRFNIKVIVSAGLCLAALALSPDAAAAPLKTSGYECIQGAAAASPVAAGGPAAAHTGGTHAAVPRHRPALWAPFPARITVSEYPLQSTRSRIF